MENYSKIFIKREFHSIVGKGWKNFWILFLVFLFTLFAIEFSRSGLKYLSYKMSDPFINWIEVKQQGDFENFKDDVYSIMDSFNIADIEANNYILQYVFNNANSKIRVEGRTISYDSKLLEKILEEVNCEVKRSQIIDEYDYGWIVTKDLMERLGYDGVDSYPPFINYTYPGDVYNIQEWGVDSYDGYIVIPIPIIAIVDQLPDLLDFIAPSYFMEQNSSGNKPFNISRDPIYFQDLVLAIDNPTNEIENEISKILDSAGLLYDTDWIIEPYELSFKTLTKYRIIFRDTAFNTLNEAANKICQNPAIHRIYDYNFDQGYTLRPNYLSLMFTDLTTIPDFASWSKETHGIRIDMAQIEAKNNFHIFSVLAWSMSIAISIIALAFVAIFIYFLIDSHFRRISKNLGTIMAFGLSNSIIRKIYVKVFIGLVIRSLLASMSVLILAEFLTGLFNLVRENGSVFFSIVDGLVITIIFLLPLISFIVTAYYLKQKLKATPGDLIFERNS